MEGDELQDYVSDFWDTFDQEEKLWCVVEGFSPPTRCEVITVDFACGLGEIGREEV